MRTAFSEAEMMQIANAGMLIMVLDELMGVLPQTEQDQRTRAREYALFQCNTSPVPGLMDDPRLYATLLEEAYVFAVNEREVARKKASRAEQVPGTLHGNRPFRMMK